MAQNGVLKAEDAQCFSVEGYIEPGSVILAVAAVILALVNTFVNKAVKQFFYNLKAELEKELFADDGISDISQSGDEESQKVGKSNVLATRIHPVPVMFTDTFRWLLQSDDTTARDVSITITNGASKTSVEVAPPTEQALSVTKNEKAAEGEHNTIADTTSSCTKSVNESKGKEPKRAKKKKKAAKAAKKKSKQAAGLEPIASSEIDM